MTPLRIYVDFAMPPEVRDLLEKETAGHQLLFPATPSASVLTKAEWDPQFATADIAFGQPDIEAIEKAGKLRWIHVSSSGITRYDTSAFRRFAAARELTVSNSAGVYSEACAMHLLSFILAQTRQLPRALETQTAGGTDSWKSLRHACVPLSGQTVLILGYGAIGKRLAEFLRPLDMKIIAYRRKPRGDEGVPVITEDQLTRTLGEIDHVVNILPDSAETRRFFDRARLATVKAGAVFYNIGRGSTVDQDALVEVLQSGHIRAAWLDVTDPEPLPAGHPLLSQPNCYLTPHVAGGHTDELKTLVHHFLGNFKRFVRGEDLADRVM